MDQKGTFTKLPHMLYDPDCIFKETPCHPTLIHIPVVPLQHRRNIKTEETAKVVTSVWEEEFIKYLTAGAVLYIGRF